MEEFYFTDHEGVGLLKSKALSRIENIEHFFTTRLGGVSKGAYASLNMGLHVNDIKEDVLENRKLALKSIGMVLDSLVVGEQVHQDFSYLVKSGDKGRGAADYLESIPAVDSLITEEKGIALMAFYADCVPVFLAEKTGKAIGIVHAGWKGVVLKNPLKSVRRMQKELGIKTEDMIVVIGPAICADCFQIGEEVAGVFINNGLQESIIYKENKIYADLKKAVRDTLLEAGLLAENIHKTDLCTCCNEELFYSHRRDQGKTGRMAAVIARK